MSGVYSLVNAPCLVRDVARHPRAGALASELLRIAALGPEQLAALDRLRVTAPVPWAPSRMRTL